MDIFYTIKWISRNFIFFLIIGLAAESAITKIRVRRSSALPTKVAVLCDESLHSCRNYFNALAVVRKLNHRRCTEEQRRRYNKIINECRMANRRERIQKRQQKKQLVV
ncbi:uncharacterized protein LOC143469005 [Clavelina lepadiformis]|uniref:uncharacterized protein LOC143469005 n=1 Tax=Clavelina lepadiformis TaxID=159417 RepID=UPI0040436914